MTKGMMGRWCMVAVLSLATSMGAARAAEFEEDASAFSLRMASDAAVNIDGQLRLLAALEGVDDAWSDSERLFLFLEQARLSVNGTFRDVDYEVEWMLGGEEVPENNSVMSLLDAYANVPIIKDKFEIKFGQFKVPYSRERLFDSGDFFQTRRSIQNNYFNIGRDVGMAAHGRTGSFTAALGVFTGGGINIPQRYIPEDLESPMFVARAGVNNGLDRDVFSPYLGNPESREIQFAAFVNALYTGDSRVGHSTPLNVKYYDKSVMLLNTWNPYIGARGATAEFTQYGADVAARLPVGEASSLLLSAEVNVSDFSNHAGELQNSGGVVGAHLRSGDWTLGIRYAVVDPDADMAYRHTDDETGEVTLYSITDQKIHEVTPSVAYFWRKYNIKVVADLALQFDVPVSLETGNGVYNLMRQPDQVTYASRGGIELQDNYLASMVVQYNF